MAQKKSSKDVESKSKHVNDTTSYKGDNIQRS
jgi:hypothetical protein